MIEHHMIVSPTRSLAELMARPGPSRTDQSDRQLTTYTSARDALQLLGARHDAGAPLGASVASARHPARHLCSERGRTFKAINSFNFPTFAARPPAGHCEPHNLFVRKDASARATLCAPAPVARAPDCGAAALCLASLCLGAQITQRARTCPALVRHRCRRGRRRLAPGLLSRSGESFVASRLVALAHHDKSHWKDLSHARQSPGLPVRARFEQTNFTTLGAAQRKLDTRRSAPAAKLNPRRPAGRLLGSDSRAGARRNQPICALH